MRRFAIVASFWLAFVVVVEAASARPFISHGLLRSGCTRFYTVTEAKRAAASTFTGARHVSRAEWLRLFHMQHCLRNTRRREAVHRHRHHAFLAWRARRNPPWLGPVIASWYYDAGGTGCGFHTTYGIAALNVPCGTRVLLEHNGRTVLATRDDSGPYVGGRVFDLNPATKAALGCSDLCSVRYVVR